MGLQTDVRYELSTDERDAIFSDLFLFWSSAPEDAEFDIYSLRGSEFCTEHLLGVSGTGEAATVVVIPFGADGDEEISFAEFDSFMIRPRKPPERNGR